MLLSVERPFVGAFAVHIPRATLLHCNGLVQAVLPASRNMCKRTIEIPQELVEILSSPRQHPGWSYRVTNSRPRRRTRPSRSENNECNRGTAKRRKRSAVGWAAGSRSALIVLLKQGNSPRRTLWRKAKRRPTDSVEGNMPNTSKFDQHVHVTRLNSFGDHVDGEAVGSRNRMR